MSGRHYPHLCRRCKEWREIGNAYDSGGMRLEDVMAAERLRVDNEHVGCKVAKRILGRMAAEGEIASRPNGLAKVKLVCNSRQHGGVK